LPLFADVGPDGPVHLVGANELMDRYATALARHGRAVVRIDGDAASLAGLAQVFQDLEAPAS
jgi:2-keto-3-deoxy-galactonokinase